MKFIARTTGWILQIIGAYLMFCFLGGLIGIISTRTAIGRPFIFLVPTALCMAIAAFLVICAGSRLKRYGADDQSSHWWDVIAVISIVIALVGLLAAISIPAFSKVVEKGRVTEAFRYIETFRQSQERFRLKNGRYSDSNARLDMALPQMQYFQPWISLPKDGMSWRISLIRTTAHTDSHYGRYTITAESGKKDFDCLTPKDAVACRNELLPKQ